MDSIAFNSQINRNETKYLILPSLPPTSYSLILHSLFTIHDGDGLHEGLQTEGDCYVIIMIDIFLQSF